MFQAPMDIIECVATSGIIVPITIPTTAVCSVVPGLMIAVRVSVTRNSKLASNVNISFSINTATLVDFLHDVFIALICRFVIKILHHSYDDQHLKPLIVEEIMTYQVYSMPIAQNKPDECFGYRPLCTE
jgi:hypothetical protein